MGFFILTIMIIDTNLIQDAIETILDETPKEERFLEVKDSAITVNNTTYTVDYECSLEGVYPDQYYIINWFSVIIVC